MKIHPHITQSISILKLIGLPKAQQNERSGLCLLALVDLTPHKKWEDATSPMIGITPIMEWARKYYKKKYAPNSRETFRRFTMHQFVAAGIALYNPDQPSRPVNSPHAVYQIAPSVLKLLLQFKKPEWKESLSAYLECSGSLSKRYAMERTLNRVPVKIIGKKKLLLSSGNHSQLIKNIIEDFAEVFVPNGTLVYVGDTGVKWGYFDRKLLGKLGVTVDSHGKMPDVVLFCSKRKWLILIEAVTSHGPVNAKRHEELADLFASSKVGLVYVTAFPTRSLMARYLSDIAWETEVWVAEAPSHLIHFNGQRFLGPYAQTADQ